MSERGKAFYHASAGTGKTYTIVERVGEFLSSTPLDKILIVTYTEKATGELKNRIRDRIEGLKDESIKKKQQTKKKESNRPQ
ncbi:MAG: UvrD-helicase domain-containing protein, partial [Candidatus Ornithospirochaeta sp.]